MLKSRANSAKVVADTGEGMWGCCDCNAYAQGTSVV